MILTILIIILFYIFITLILRKYIKKTNYKLNNINYILDNTKDILDNAKKALDNDGIIIISQFLNSDGYAQSVDIELTNPQETQLEQVGGQRRMLPEKKRKAKNWHFKFLRQKEST